MTEQDTNEIEEKIEEKDDALSFDDVETPDQVETFDADVPQPAEAQKEEPEEGGFDFDALEDELLMTEDNNLEDHADAAESVLLEHDELPTDIVEDAEEPLTASAYELKSVIEALLFVSEDPLPIKALAKVLGDVAEIDIQAALELLVSEYDERQSGLEIREIAGGWRISTRAQHHDFIRAYLKSRPSAKLSLPALETLAVIAYKQPITIPEILEIRGVSSSSAIKTLLEKRLIVTKGRKETVGRPMMYGTSKDFLMQFGLKDLNELPSIEDFEDLAQ
jgi:segregation and condensation protein B